MIPKTLAEWNIDAIERLLTLGYREAESFDWKVALPHGKDEEGKERIVKSCAAFANSAGGFLVFGVSDDASTEPRNRMVGIDPGVEFFEHFGIYPQRCRPTVPWTALNPPLRLADGREIHVVHVVRGWNGPHCYEERRGGLIFPKRTNKGNEIMSYDEIRGAFLGYHEKRIKLQLLRSELDGIRNTLNSMWVARAEMDSKFPTVTFDLAVIEGVLSDTYTILATNQTLLSELSTVRRACKNINNRLAIIFSSSMLPSADRQKSVQDLNYFVSSQSHALDASVVRAIQALDGILRA